MPFGHDGWAAAAVVRARRSVCHAGTSSRSALVQLGWQVRVHPERAPRAGHIEEAISAAVRAVDAIVTDRTRSRTSLGN